MREILFRGIPKDDTVRHFFADIWKENCEGSFVYGSLVVAHDRYYICVSAMCSMNSCINNGMTSMIEVIPETIGQYGLCDKNGKKIFEGDIIHSLYANCKINEHIEKVVFRDGAFKSENAEGGFFAKIAGQGSPKHLPNDTSVYMIECEIIGNIHDNPELLRKEDEGK